MKSHSIVWNSAGTTNVPKTYALADLARKILGKAHRILLAGASALGILIAAAWLISMPGLAPFLYASLWAAGFVFLALCVEAEKPLSGALLFLTGLALPLLAWLASRISPEFAMVAAAVIAVWAATGTLKRSS